MEATTKKAAKLPSKSFIHFNALIKYVDQLIAIHGKLQAGRGRRHEQDTLHRAGVVLVVAAWESYVEQVLIEAVESLENDAGFGTSSTAVAAPQWARHAFQLRKAEIMTSVKRFHTPDATGVRDLFLGTLEFNPWPHWVWQIRRRQWNQDEMRRRLNAWLKIRHSIAHGVSLPSEISWISGPKGNPRLTLPLLKECRKYFLYIATQTDDAIRDFLIQHHGVTNPW